MNAIIGMVWRFLAPILVDLAITVGFPKAVEFLLKKGLPKWLVEGLVTLIKQALKEISGLPVPVSKGDVRQVKREARQKARDCVGAACAMETKEL